MNQKIFISMASYLDPMLFFTLQDAIDKAQQPDLLRFAVIDQNFNDQRETIRALPYSGQIRYLHIHPQDTLGVSWARNLAFSLYDGEQYLLQIDSHMCFENGWDQNLRTQHSELLNRSAKPIISTYPYRFDMVDGAPKYTPTERKTALVLRPHPETPLTDGNLVLRFVGKHIFTDKAVPGCHLAAGFIFCAGRFIDEVPYDPFLYFHGEEQSLSIRGFTRGWDIFHPTWTPLYHLYKEANTPHETHHWHGEIDSQRVFNGAYLTERSKNRLTQLLCGDETLGAHGLGSVRCLDDYTALSGIDYRNRVITDPFQGRLI